ncbi:MAG TPA: fibronectin type III domain-containing protein, partial [Flavisolibacter sp.]|nr:fibronectin type III domain-containing protein [Flavisolibacter sp.]
LYARASNNTSVSLGNILGSPHRYLIKWNASNFEFYVDGSTTPVATINFTVNQNMYLQISDLSNTDGTLAVDWLRVKPYASAGSFTSRIFDYGSATDWGLISWTATQPAGTGITVSVRTGNTATPDGSWSAFAAVGNGGSVNANARYVQYRADLSTTDQTVTPVLQDISIACNTTDVTAPVITNVTATSAANGLSATITWTTNENADSKVEYGTDATLLNQTVSDAAMLTAHSMQLTGLLSGVTYYFRVSSTDAATNSATSPNPPAAPLSFTTVSPPCFEDITVANFASGTTGPATYGSSLQDGEIMLKPALAEEFSGTSIPAGWNSGTWNTGGTITVGGGQV